MKSTLIDKNEQVVLSNTLPVGGDRQSQINKYELQVMNE